MPAQSLTSYEFRWGSEMFDTYLVKALEKSELIKMSPEDEYLFGINNDPILFWGNIMVEMSYWESKWNPATYYKESFGLYSRGLFQLSLVDGKRYGCNFITEQSVHNPKANIECAVKVMQKLIKQDNNIAGKHGNKWLGAARYFSTLRGTRDYTAKALTAIRGANR